MLFNFLVCLVCCCVHILVDLYHVSSRPSQSLQEQQEINNYSADSMPSTVCLVAAGRNQQPMSEYFMWVLTLILNVSLSFYYATVNMTVGHVCVCVVTDLHECAEVQ